MPLKILVLGNSHTMALKDAIDSLGGEKHSEDFVFEVHWLKLGKHGSLDPKDALNLVRALKPSDKLILSLVGTSHNIIGLLQQSPPLWFLVKDSQKSGNFVSEGLLSNHFAKQVSNNKTLVKLIETAKCGVYHLITPPPKGNQEYLLSLAKRKKGVYRNMEINAESLNSPEYRLAMWQIEMRSIGIAFAKYDVKLLDVPKEALTEDGFLLESLYSEDFTHASSQYGQLLLKSIKDEFND